MYSISIQNMSQVNSEEICIYNDESVIEAFKLESAVLKQEEGNAGTLTIKVPPTNVGYSAFETLTTMAIVRKKGEDYPYDEPKVVWIGRLLEMKIDFDNNKEIVFEGAYNFLMDTIQPPYHAKTDITLWAAYMISNHNTMVQASGQGWKTINVGVFDTALNPTETTDLYTDYDTTLDMINNVCEGWNAHPRFRYGYSQTYHCWQLILDLYSTYNSSGERPQIIFGENLTDYTREYKNEDTATVVIPRGKKYTDAEWNALPAGTEPAVPDGIDKYRTIYSVNNQSVYCYPNEQDTEAVANLQRYGFICKVVDFTNEIDYDALKASGEKYLRDQKWDKTTITISGFDLKLLDYNTVPIKIGEMVHCLSRPHGLDYNYPCTGIEENLMEVGSTTYVLGFSDDRYMTDASRQSDEKLRDAITQAVSREKILQQNTYNYTNSSIEDYDTQTVQGYVQDLEDEIAAISFDPSEAVEEAKTNALQLLNIYDAEKNPTKKGYVHFIKETADYNAGTELTFSQLKARINKYDSGSTNAQTFLNNLENWLANPVYNDDWCHVICVALGEEDYQTDVVVYNCSPNYSRSDNHRPYFLNTSPYKIFTSYNGSYVAYSARYHRYRASGSPNIETNTFNTIIRSTAASDNGSNLWSSNKQLSPNESYIDNPALKFYCNVDIYESSSSNNIRFTKNLIMDPPSTALTIDALKSKILSKISTSGGLTTFMSRLDECMAQSSDNRAMIYVMVKVNNGVEDWNYFKVQLIHHYWYDNASYYNKSFYLYNDGGMFDGFTQPNGVDNYSSRSRIYGLIEVAGNNTRVYIDQTNSTNSSGTTNKAPMIDNIANVAYILPNKNTLDDTSCNYYLSTPIAVSQGSATNYADVNLVDHIADPQDHITEIVISDKSDYMANDANVWRWNKDGLYYLNNGYYGGHSDATLDPSTEGYGTNTDNLRMALTKDGYIVADRVAVGQLDAGIVRTGVLMGNPAVPGDPEGEADFKINVNTGTILSKKARLVFSNVRTNSGTMGDPDQALNEFAYLSNQALGRLTSVAGKTSKDWMLVIGSSFGVDKWGRTYMREGHIGGVGGAFDVIGYNEEPIQAVSSYVISGGYGWNYKIVLATDAYRPKAAASEAVLFRYRLGHYVNDQITCVTDLFTITFSEGSEPYETLIDFETVDNVAPYYPGELFPVWYIKDDNGEYVQDNVHYTQKTGVDSNYKVEQNGWADEQETQPMWISYTDERFVVGGVDQTGTINIGSGFLDNGTTGQNRSFYLGGINRTATVANRQASDWRLTVGSRFGVTENGNLYANNATLSNVWASGSITGSSFSASYIPPLSFNATNPIEANYFLSMFDWKFWSESDGGMFSSTTRLSIIYTGSDPSGRDKSSIMERDLNITFKPSVYEFRGSGSHYEDGRRAASPITVTYSKTGDDRQDFVINTSDWNDPDEGWTFADRVYILIDINNSSQMFYLQGQNQIKSNVNDPGDGTLYWLTGNMTMLKINSQSGRRAVNCGSDFIGSGWLGGQYMPWAKLYVDSVINTSSKIYKHDIEGLDLRYDKLLDILRPVRFKFNKDHYDDGDLYHTGFILEELGECMKIAGIKPEEFAAYDPNPDGKGGGIRYSEFIPLIVDQLQKLKRENEDLKRQLYEKGILDD